MKKILFLILTLIVPVIGISQNRGIYFDHYDALSGLPDDYIRDIAQDARGYIWIGTQSGLVRYDGYRYKIYQLGNPKINRIARTDVITIYVDKSQNLWVTLSENGLFKYNPATDSFEQFSYPRTPMQFVYAIDDDETGLWCGAYVGPTYVLVRFNFNTKRFDFFGPNEKNRYLFKPKLINVFKTADRSVWLGSDNGLFHYDAKSDALQGYFTNSDTARAKRVIPFYESPSAPGILWIKTRGRHQQHAEIFLFDTHTHAQKPFNIDTLKYGQKIGQAYEDRKGQLWFATDSGLLKKDKKTGDWSLYVQQDTFLHGQKNPFTEMAPDGAGDFWLSTKRGLLRFHPSTNQFESFLPDLSQPGAFSDFFPRAPFIDKSGVPWIGTDIDGVNRPDRIKSAFTTYTVDKTGKKGLPDNMIANADKSGVELNDNTNLYEWRPGTYNTQKFYTLPAGERFYGGMIKGKDGIWYISTSKGFRVYDPVKKTDILYPVNPKDSTAFPTIGVGYIMQASDGTIWIGTGDWGMVSFDIASKKFKRYPFRSDLKLTTQANNRVLDDGNAHVIYEDRQHNIWVGTNDGGLNRFDRKTGKFISYYTRQNFSITCILAIHQDRFNRLWVTSYEEGLFLFDPQKGTYTKRITEQNGLISNDIRSIDEDSTGNLWLGAQRGFSRMNLKNLEIKNFKAEDIIPGKTIANSNSLTAVLGNGDIAFPLNTGLVTFNPADLADNQHPPFVNIEDVYFTDPLSNDENGSRIIVAGQKKLEASYNQNKVTFNFVAIHFDNSAENTYAYKLSGYDKNWVQGGHTRWATYTNLPAGTYTFTVIAANSSAVWNKTGDNIVIVINAPWWVRWWAWALWILLFVSAVYAFIAYRSRKLLQDKKVLEHKVHIRTEEVMQQKEEIEAQRDELEQTLGELKATQTQLIQSEKMASLGELTAGIAHEIQNPLNFVNNFSEVSAELVDELDEELDKGDIAEAKAIASDVKQNLEKIRHHGKRADGIVKGMLEHSRAASGQKEPTDLNKLADEYLRLAYHGLRAKDKSFNAELITQFDESLPLVNVIPQDIGRVMLNLFNNAFYAVNQKQKNADADYKPNVSVTTNSVAGQVIIKVKDNGPGIPDSIKDKIMQPFFTTKPTGEGTGLGLSLSYDIVVKGHAGTINVESKEGEGSTFTITMPYG